MYLLVARFSPRYLLLVCYMLVFLPRISVFFLIVIYMVLPRISLACYLVLWFLSLSLMVSFSYLSRLFANLHNEGKKFVQGPGMMNDCRCQDSHVCYLYKIHFTLTVHVS
jgi:hypothetical protein